MTFVTGRAISLARERDSAPYPPTVVPHEIRTRGVVTLPDQPPEALVERCRKIPTPPSVFFTITDDAEPVTPQQVSGRLEAGAVAATISHPFPLSGGQEAADGGVGGHDRREFVVAETGAERD